MQMLLNLCCLVLLFFACTAFAQNENSAVLRSSSKEQLLEDIKRVAGKMPAEWLKCNQSTDCSLVAYNCGMALAVNKNHLKDAQGVICKTELCSWFQCVPNYSFTAACEQSQCVTKAESLKPQ